MAHIPLNKTIEAKRVNKRTGLIEPGPETTIPFGALVKMVKNEGETVTFTYMMDLYRCAEDLWRSATADSAVPIPAAAAPARAGAAASAPAQLAARLQWQGLPSSHFTISRAKVPGGWLIALNSAGIAFYPDARHKWDGLSLP
jgi:hypothetical protein